MVQLGPNDTQLDIILKDVLDNFLRISNLKGNDKMRMVFFKMTHQFR